MVKQAATKKNKLTKSIHEMPVYEKINTIQKGVSKKELEKIKDQLNVNYEILSSVLSVSRSKLINTKGVARFDTVTSERIIILSEIVHYGQHIFGNNQFFTEWIKKENRFFHGKKPLEMLSTFHGMQEVKDELGRIDHGVF